MEQNITCRFMSIEDRKLPDGHLYALNVYVNNKPVTLYLAENNVFVSELAAMAFGDEIDIKVEFVEHPKVANAYKMKFRGLV